MMALLKSRDTNEKFNIPVGETTLGRGPFLKVTETKVSRNHAVIKFDTSGSLQIKPIHKNPTFLLGKSKQKWHPLPKDHWHELNQGDTIALLPDSWSFEINLESEKSETEESTKEVIENTETPAGRQTEVEISKPGKSSLKDLPTSYSGNTTDNLDPASFSSSSRKRQLPSWMLEIKSGPEPKKKTGPKRSAKKAAPATIETIEEDSEIVPRKKSKPRKKIIEDEEDETTIENKSSPESILPEVRNKKEDSPIHKISQSVENTRGKKLPSPIKVAPKQDFLSELMGFGETSIKDTSNKGEKQHSTKSSIPDTEGEEPDMLSQLMGVSKKNDKCNEKLSAESEPSGHNQNDTKDEQSRRSTSSKGDDQSLEKANDSVEKKKKTLPKCAYGKKCYRRNPVHFQEYSHDDDEDEKKEDGDDKDDDDRLECEYGTSCYRTNLQHMRDFKHTIDVTKAPSPVNRRPKRAAKKKSVMDGDSDDEGENTYDYEDSFLDDDDDGDDDDDDDFDDDETDEDYQPDSGKEDENLSELVDEAKDFISSKK